MMIGAMSARVRRLANAVSAVRLVAALVLALLAVGVTMDAAGAQPSSTGDQNAFVFLCKAGKGKSKSVATRVVKCTFPDGHTTTCDFNYSPSVCTSTLETSPFDITQNAAGGNTKVNGGSAPSQNPITATKASSSSSVAPIEAGDGMP